MSLLDSISSPADLRSLSVDALHHLADEVRTVIIQTVSQNGGHLASSLGCVELAIALHLAYDAPRDKIIWDTGHQAYPHKLLTGRRDQFHTLRQLGGLSGFPRRDESPYDCWGVGHAGTAVSAATGMALARDLKKERYHVVAVVGDASIASGMSLEALNHAGDMHTDMTVVLNDNKMSIAAAVGALTTIISRMRSQPWYQQAEKRARHVLGGLPGPAARSLTKQAEGIRLGFTHYIAPNNTGAVFEEMGFHYIGPIDGHNIELMAEVFTDARKLSGPVLIHVITTKGKGYSYSENNATVYHGVPPFCVEDGKLVRSEDGPSFTQVFGDELIQLAQQDPRVVAITAAMPDGTGLSAFQQRFPDRLYDVGIAEEHAVCFAAAMAAEGLRPVVAIYSSFMQRAFDQIMHDVALQRLPVVLALDRAGLVGDDGPTHHGCFDLSWLRSIPGLTVLAPRDGEELRAMLRYAFRLDGPVAIRYPRASAVSGVPHIDEPELDTETGSLLLDGSDVMLMSAGSMADRAVAAARQLKEMGIDAGVWNARFIKPLDSVAIRHMAARTTLLVTLEENSRTGGFGTAVTEVLADAGMSTPLLILGLPDQFTEHGARNQLLNRLGLDPEGICRSVAAKWREVSGQPEPAGLRSQDISATA